MESRDPVLPDVYEMCCGKQKCPKISRNGDGIVITDEHGIGADVPNARIEFDPAQARELKKWLEQKGF